MQNSELLCKIQIFYAKSGPFLDHFRTFLTFSDNGWFNRQKWQKMLKMDTKDYFYTF